MALDYNKYALKLIKGEYDKQVELWGDDRDDSDNGEMAQAAMAQIGIAIMRDVGVADAAAVSSAEEQYFPDEWTGLRNYSPDGSNVANLVVAAAYLQNEIKRRLKNGEDPRRVIRKTL